MNINKSNVQLIVITKVNFFLKYAIQVRLNNLPF